MQRRTRISAPLPRRPLAHKQLPHTIMALSSLPEPDSAAFRAEANGPTAGPEERVGSQAAPASPLHEHEDELLSPIARSAVYKLQTRIGLLVGFAENVQAAHTRMPPEVLEEQLGLIVQNGHRLSEIIDELLGLTEQGERR